MGRDKEPAPERGCRTASDGVASQERPKFQLTLPTASSSSGKSRTPRLPMAEGSEAAPGGFGGGRYGTWDQVLK